MEQISTIEYMKKSTPNGYIKILTDDGWKMEHIFIVEKFIGRELNDKEVVHHIDENKLNNDINNLVIFPNVKEHSHFHRQIKQFGYTQPRISEINKLKLEMLKERKRLLDEN